QSLIYWWMGLSFITDPIQHHLFEPPGKDDAGRVHTATTLDGRRVPHPLAGVSPQAQLLLGRVGSLVFGQRMRCRARLFTTLGNIQREYTALQEAQTLEQELLSLELPREDELFDVTDPDTPLKDLINTADAYRLSALILLYRAFPDLLRDRL